MCVIIAFIELILCDVVLRCGLFYFYWPRLIYSGLLSADRVRALLLLLSSIVWIFIGSFNMKCWLCRCRITFAPSRHLRCASFIVYPCLGVSGSWLTILNVFLWAYSLIYWSVSSQVACPIGLYDKAGSSSKEFVVGPRYSLLGRFAD